MGKTTLVDADILAGGALIDALDRSGFVVTSALWYFDADRGEWTLLLATPIVDRLGPKTAYRRLRETLDSTRGDVTADRIAPDDIAIVSPSSQIIRAVRHGVTTGPREITDIQVSRTVFDRVFIEDAHVYRAA